MAETTKGREVNKLHEKAQKWHANARSYEAICDLPRADVWRECANELDALAEQMRQEIEALPRFEYVEYGGHAKRSDDPNWGYVDIEGVLRLFGAKEP